MPDVTDLADYFYKDTTAFTDFTLSVLKENGLDYEIYENKISKNVKNRGFPQLNEELSWDLIKDAYETLNEECEDIFDLTIFTEGRMGGHWCLSSKRGDSPIKILNILDVKLTPLGRKVLSSDNPDDWFSENGDIIVGLVVAKPKKSFLEFNDGWESTIKYLESVDENKYAEDYDIHEDEDEYPGLMS
jgi:hypothetical protein